MKKKKAYEADIINGQVVVHFEEPKKVKTPSYADFRCPRCGADLTEDPLGAFCLQCDWPNEEEDNDNDASD